MANAKMDFNLISDGKSMTIMNGSEAIFFERFTLSKMEFTQSVDIIEITPIWADNREYAPGPTHFGLDLSIQSIDEPPKIIPADSIIFPVSAWDLPTAQLLKIIQQKIRERGENGLGKWDRGS